LAALEMLVHLDRLARQMPMVILEVEFPDSPIREVFPADLPQGWNLAAGADSLKRLGADWLRGMQSFAMRVPSVVVPEEANFLINPRHPDAARIKVGKPVPWRFDARLAAQA
jgi:RES domain-containing protein